MKVSFNKENVTELISQIVKILGREGKTPEAQRLIKEMKALSVEIQKELKSAPKETYASLKSVIRKKISKVA